MLPLHKKSTYLNMIGRASRFFFIAFCCFSLHVGHAQWKQTHSFEKEWLVYQPSVKSFLPYFSSKHFGYKSKSILLNPSDFPEEYVRMNLNEDYDLFIQGTFQRHLPKNTHIRLSLDSLQKKFASEKQLVFTFYRNEFKGLPKEIVLERKIRVSTTRAADIVTFNRRDPFIFYQFIGISFLVMLFFFGTLYAAFPRYFQSYFQFSDWINWVVKDGTVFKSPFAFPNLWVILILSFLTAFISFYSRMTHQSSENQYENLLNVGASLRFLSTKILIGFVLFISRYFMFKICANLFNLSKVAEVHYFKVIQTNFQFFTLSFIIISLYSLYQGPLVSINFTNISYVITGYFVLRSVYLFQVFRKSFPVNQLSLLAYLILMEGQVLVFGLRELIFPEYI
jgi:hypothetical protein